MAAKRFRVLCKARPRLSENGIYDPRSKTDRPAALSSRWVSFPRLARHLHAERRRSFLVRRGQALGWETELPFHYLPSSPKRFPCPAARPCADHRDRAHHYDLLPARLLRIRCPSDAHKDYELLRVRRSS